MAPSWRPWQYGYSSDLSFLPPTHHSSRRGTLATTAHDIVQNAVPDLLDYADLFLSRLLDSGSHEVRDGVEVDAVGVAVV